MTRLEDKLLELGYEKQWAMGCYKNIILSPLRFQIAIYIQNDYKMFVFDEEVGAGQIKTQQDIDKIQQAFNQMQKDLEVLEND